MRDRVLGMLPGQRVLVRGPRSRRRVALTFDDGPQPSTLELLDVLDRLGVPATFFIMGDLTESRPEVVREYVRRGHQVGSHGYNHHRFPRLLPDELAAQLAATDLAIGPQVQGKWVRPPYGAIDLRSLARLMSTGYTVALWSFDSQDYEERDPEAIVARCHPSAIAPGEVLLFHEGMPATVAALPRVVAALAENGYECVTMADLFAR